MKIQQLSKSKMWFFSILVFLLFFGGVEATLRIVGFEYYSYVKYMNFYFEEGGIPSGGYVSEPNQDNMSLYILHKKDPLLFWRNVPNTGPVNAQGFVNSTRRTYPLIKESHVYRIISLGCSCTNRGWITYPERLENLLNEVNGSDMSFEVINAGVGGYSSYQGMRYFTNELLKYSPDLVTVYFGWNDHWRAIHYPDKLQPRANDFSIRVQEVLNHARFYQFLHKSISVMTARTKSKQDKTFHPRVSTSDYRQNIEAIISAARKHSINVLLLTAPHALNPENTKFYIRLGLITPEVDLNKTHRRYNDVIRDIAEAERVTMVDLESLFDSLPDKSSYFLKDGIHHREKGLSVIAQAIFEVMKQNGVVSSIFMQATEFSQIDAL
jgi:lysophospholipase L1-like esterase